MWPKAVPLLILAGLLVYANCVTKTLIFDDDAWIVDIPALDDPPQYFKDMEGRRLLTFGSCFAVNMGRMLREKGCSVYTMVIAEDVNSPFNNLQLLRRLFRGEKTPISDELAVISDLDYDALRQEFRNASDIVFTLGNIYHLEFDGT